jgi:hypothetical protein
MTNSATFENLVNDYLALNHSYNLQINNFRKYLWRKHIEERAFSLDFIHIDEFFLDSCEENIGTGSQVASYIAALKSLFNFLNESKYDFTSLLGYITSDEFRPRIEKLVDKIRRKGLIPTGLLINVLNAIDTYISENTCDQCNDTAFDKQLFETMIGRLFIKLSLILPIKTSQMIDDVCLGNIKNIDMRVIFYREITVIIPNNLRKDIIATICYAESKCGKAYSESDKLFHYLYSCIGKTATQNEINVALPHIYERLNLHEMLVVNPGGKRKHYKYPAECYKITSINSMLTNGANILCIRKLTGLTLDSIISKFDTEMMSYKRDAESAEINSSLVACDYYSYL